MRTIANLNANTALLTSQNSSNAATTASKYNAWSNVGTFTAGLAMKYGPTWWDKIQGTSDETDLSNLLTSTSASNVGWLNSDYTY